MRTVRPLEVDETDGDAESGGERGTLLEIRRLREASFCAVVAVVAVVVVVVPEDPTSSADDALFWRSTLRSVCRLFWNHTVTERSSL